MISRFLGDRKKYIIYKVRGFLLRYVQGNGLYIDSISLSNWGGKFFFSSQHCTQFILPSEFWISIHNDRYWPILDNYENEIVWISFHSSHFSLKWAVSTSKFPMYLKYNIYIQDKKIELEGQKNGCNGNPNYIIHKYHIIFQHLS